MQLKESSEERRLINYQKYQNMWDTYEQQINKHFLTKKKIIGKKVNRSNIGDSHEKIEQLYQKMKIDHEKPTLSSIYFQTDSASSLENSPAELQLK